LLTITPSVPVLLTADTQYWLVGAPLSDLTFSVFDSAVTGGSMLRIVNKNNETLQFFDDNNPVAFDVIGTPEAGTITLVATALILIGFFQRYSIFRLP
jgi:hypothetical protein